jgi:uncharacterized protein (DUF1697 family)
LDRPAVSGYVALLRAVNVGGTGIIRMADLKALCEAIGFRDVTTLLQSGNVAFRAKGTDAGIAKKLADAIEKSHGFRPAVMVRTADEIAAVMAANPFKAEEKSDPAHLIVSFAGDAPSSGAAERVAAMFLSGRELYIHYATGQGTSKVTNTVIERALGVPATARNWNTIGKLLALARALD